MSYKKIGAAMLTLVVATSIGLAGAGSAHAQGAGATSTFLATTTATTTIPGTSDDNILYQTPGVPSTGAGGGQLTEQIMMLAVGIMALGGTIYLASQLAFSKSEK